MRAGGGGGNRTGTVTLVVAVAGREKRAYLLGDGRVFFDPRERATRHGWVEVLAGEDGFIGAGGEGNQEGRRDLWA